MRTNEDNVIIRQGDSGDRLYVILKGRVSIYVVQDKENDQEIRQHVEKVLAKAKLDKLLDRTQLGQHVWTSNEGQAFGEVALIKEDCVRTASVVTDEDTDLMVVDRALYNRSVRDVLEREFHEKTEFVENNPLFKQWLPKMKKSMTIALQKETMHYGSPVVRQGQPVENIFFMLRGEAEVIADQASHKTQYPEIWGELQRILPDLLPKPLPSQLYNNWNAANKQYQVNDMTMALLQKDNIGKRTIPSQLYDNWIAAKGQYQVSYNDNGFAANAVPLRDMEATATACTQQAI
ncbi:unnamed protein product [Mytilus edulis]|uniref:Cyclic nucleotide-binding domain-containing protein n=1 Tax=Mytilus edulis TaxID=6550 RepID=A0A8S3PWU8_MYTED|nr:unnamed protein product [Mytilus edulis]